MSYTYRSDIAPARAGAEIAVADGRYANANLNCARAKFTAPAAGVSSGGVILLAELPTGAVVFPALGYINGAGSGAVIKAGSSTLTSGAVLIDSAKTDITLTLGEAATSGTVIEAGIVFGSLT